MMRTIWTYQVGLIVRRTLDWRSLKIQSISHRRWSPRNQGKPHQPWIISSWIFRIRETIWGLQTSPRRKVQISIWGNWTENIVMNNWQARWLKSSLRPKIQEWARQRKIIPWSIILHYTQRALRMLINSSNWLVRLMFRHLMASWISRNCLSWYRCFHRCRLVLPQRIAPNQISFQIMQ